VLGILGESGSGKSTLAHAILQMLPKRSIQHGDIILGDRDLLRMTESELRTIRGRQISLVSQDPVLSLNPVLTVGMQVDEVLRAHLTLSARERRDQVHELFYQVGFEQPSSIYAAYPHQLSGGQRQRVVIAQAIACRPALLIADEPTSKLDASLAAEVIALLDRIRETHGTAILMISHDPKLLTGFADRIAVTYAGRVIELGDCSSVFTRPLHPYSQALMQIARASMDVGAAIKSPFPTIDGERAGPHHGLAGCQFAPRCIEKMEICATHFPGGVAAEPLRSVSCFKYGE